MIMLGYETTLSWGISWICDHLGLREGNAAAKNIGVNLRVKLFQLKKIHFMGGFDRNAM